MEEGSKSDAGSSDSLPIGGQLKSGRPNRGRRGIRLAFQAVALVAVCWGVWHSVRNVSTQLEARRGKLASEAQDKLQQSQQTDDPRERARLRKESERLQSAVSRFWYAAPDQLLAASFFYACGMLPASIFWRRCLLTLDQPGHNLLDVLWAYFYGNLGKYFPGKAMVIVLRVGALEKHGIQKTATVITVFMETLTMMSVGGATSAICLIALGVDWRFSLLAAGLLIVTFIPTSPPVLKVLLPKLQKGVDTQKLATWTQRISWPLFIRGWIMLTFTWLSFGLSLLFVLRALPSADFAGAQASVILLSSLGACALAVVLGFVSLIPGGAGVREVVLSAVLTPVVGPIAALCAALWLRIVWLATELFVVAFLAAIIGLRHLRGGRIANTLQTPDPV